MYARAFRGILPGVAAAALGLTVVSSSALAIPIYVIDDDPGQHIMSFDSATPGALQTSFAIQGLQPNEKLIGIDFRINSVTPTNFNTLYGVGSFGRIYTVNPGTGAATFVAALTDSVSGLPIVLNGTEFGFDFNPQADRLRIVSDLDQNLRINVDTGVTVVDSATSPLNPGNPNITDAAYDRVDLDGSTLTTLFGIDTVNNNLVRIGGVDGSPSPNGGTITPIGPMNTINAINIGGFDISSGGSPEAFAALRGMATTDGSSLFTINLNTGLATLLGPIGNAEDQHVIKGLAVGPGPGVPEPATAGLLAAGAVGLLASRRRRSR